MRLFLKSLCVAALLAVPVALVASTAEAAEKYLGTVIVTDAGMSNNYLPMDGGAFNIPGLTLLTVQPNAAAYVCVNEFAATGLPTCSATNPAGVKVTADQALPTSCPVARQILMADGGYVTGCVVVVMPVSGTSVSAPVWSREGNGARPEF